MAHKKNHRVLISAGDPSGDLLMSRVVRTLRTLAKSRGVDLEFVGLAGPLCQDEGVQILAQSQDVAVVGIVEVLKNLKKIFSVLDKLKRELPKVDSVLCVDFPDFNFRLSRMAKKLGKPVDYLVAPQVWAWRGGRIHEMKTWLRRLYCVLPFEPAIFRDVGVDAVFMGHPLRDILPPRARTRSRAELGLDVEDQAMVLMPGSRRSEISRHLPIFIEAWTKFQKGLQRRRSTERYRALLPLARGIELNDLQSMIRPHEWQQVQTWLSSGEWIVHPQSWTVMQAGDFGWIASGTATLEAAYYQLPHILIYKLSGLSAMMIKRFTNYFGHGGGSAGLPNILLEKRVIPELLQDDLNADRLVIETVEMLSNGGRMAGLRRDLKWIPKRLGEARVVERISESLLDLWIGKSL